MDRHQSNAFGCDVRERSLSCRLVPDLDAAATARRAVHQLEPVLGARRVQELALVVTELVTNSVVHGPGDPIELSIEVDAEGVVHGEVVDQGDSAHRPELTAPSTEGGWGLQIVDVLARRWGVQDGSTHVWFEYG